MSIFKDENNEQEYTGIVEGAVEGNNADGIENEQLQDSQPDFISESGAVESSDAIAVSDNADEIAQNENDLTSSDENADSAEEDSNTDGEYYTSLSEASEPAPAKKEPKTVPFWVVPFVAILVFVICVGTFLGFKYVPQIVESYQNSRLVEDGKLYTALDVYNAAYQEDTTDKKAAKNAAEVMFKLGYFTNAESTLQTAYTDEELQNTTDEDLKFMVEYIEKINNTMDKANTLYSEISSSGDSDDSNALWENANSQLEALYGNEEYCDEFVAYYQYVFASIFGQDIATQKEYVQKACDFNSQISYMFYPTLAAMNRFDGQYDEAIKVCQTALEYNIEDFSSLVEMSYNYLLKGDFENGVTYAEKAYDISPEEEVTINALMLAYAASGNTEKYDEISAQASALGIEPDSQIQGYLDGTYTLEDILIGAV